MFLKFVLCVARTKDVEGGIHILWNTNQNTLVKKNGEWKYKSCFVGKTLTF
jgi:hypothetical protein